MKKYILKIIIFMISLISICICSNATTENDASIELVVSTDSIEEVSINANLVNQHIGITAFDCFINYDEEIFEKLTIDSITPVFEEKIDTFRYNANTKKLIIVYDEALENVGKLFTIKLKPRSEIMQQTDIYLSYITAYNLYEDVFLIDEQNSNTITAGEPDELIYLKTDIYKIGNENENIYEYGDEYIAQIPSDTTIEEFKNNISTNGEVTIYDIDGTTEVDNDNTALKTGMKIKIHKEGYEDIELVIILQKNEEPDPEPLYLKTDTYKIGDNDETIYEEGDEYIAQIPMDTTIEELLNNISTNGEITIYDIYGTTEISNNETKLKTGMKIKIHKEGSEDIELVIIVEKNKEPDPEPEPEPVLEPLYLNSNIYKIGDSNITTYNKGDEYIARIFPNTTVEEFLNNISTNGEVTIYDIDGITEINSDENQLTMIKTSMKIKVCKEGSENIELTIVVIGDIDENGHITTTDLAALKQAVQREIELKESQYRAADINEDKTLSATDLATMIQLILKELVDIVF